MFYKGIACYILFTILCKLLPLPSSYLLLIRVSCWNMVKIKINVSNFRDLRTCKKLRYYYYVEILSNNYSK